MASEFDIARTAGAVYAQSLLELADEAGQAQAIGEELADLLELWRRDTSFSALMRSAAIDEDPRRESLRRIFGSRVSKLVINLLLVLNDKGRLMILPQLCEAYQKRLDERSGRQKVYVASASALDDAARTKIKEHARRLLARDAVLAERVDPELLGGFTLQIGDRLYDYSLRRRLSDARNGLRTSMDRHLVGGLGRFVKQG